MLPEKAGKFLLTTAALIKPSRRSLVLRTLEEFLNQAAVFVLVSIAQVIENVTNSAERVATTQLVVPGLYILQKSMSNWSGCIVFGMNSAIDRLQSSMMATISFWLSLTSVLDAFLILKKWQLSAYGHVQRLAENLMVGSLKPVALVKAVTVSVLYDLIAGLPSVAAQEDQPPSYGSVLSSGIQDISAIAALFGTETCANHTLECMAGGYMYAATQSWSMLGSLGLVKAIMYSTAPLSLLAQAGFKEPGRTLSLFEEGKIRNMVHWAVEKEGMIDAVSVVEEAWWDKKTKTWVHGSSWCIRSWIAAITGVVGICPFLWPMLTEWSAIYSIFPILRVSASMIASAVLPSHLYNTMTGKKDAWLLLSSKAILWLSGIGILVGYVGSFTYIQQFQDSRMAYVWVALEIFLSICRVAIWAANPNFDDLHKLRLSCEVDSQLGCRFDLSAVSAQADELPPILLTYHVLTLNRMRAHAGLCALPLNSALIALVVVDNEQQLYIIPTEFRGNPFEGAVHRLRPVLRAHAGQLTFEAWALCGRGNGLATIVAHNDPSDEKWAAELQHQYSPFIGVLTELKKDLGKRYSPSYRVTLKDGIGLKVKRIGDFMPGIEDGMDSIKNCGCNACTAASKEHVSLVRDSTVIVEQSVNGLAIRWNKEEGMHGPLTGLIVLLALQADTEIIKAYIAVRSAVGDNAQVEGGRAEKRFALLFYIAAKYSVQAWDNAARDLLRWADCEALLTNRQIPLKEYHKLIACEVNLQMQVTGGDALQAALSNKITKISINAKFGFKALIEEVVQGAWDAELVACVPLQHEDVLHKLAA
ncbi:hypothetical protein INT43_000325 [Umbelopsis isabellina]|uniref:Uncharacterized protein n=1 Tax=Mortierella isabellina TaxID=91625 RepID=A0A8H7UG19_MORIS|nr:hypothetical protein INT43_000325 [Umbelopsis isabellina]